MTASHNGRELTRVCLISEVIVDVVCTAEMREMPCLFLFLGEANTSLHGEFEYLVFAFYPCLQLQLWKRGFITTITKK